LKDFTLYTYLLLALGAGLFFQSNTVFAQDKGEKQPVMTESSIDSVEKEQKKTDLTFIVYYFHGRKRCSSCRTIEMYTHDAILDYFPAELESDRMEWRIVNFANPKNKHFKDDFELYTQSVVLVEMEGNEMVRWKNLKDVWRLIRNKDAYYEYIREEVSAFLTEGK